MKREFLLCLLYFCEISRFQCCDILQKSIKLILIKINWLWQKLVILQVKVNMHVAVIFFTGKVRSFRIVFKAFSFRKLIIQKQPDPKFKSIDQWCCHATVCAVLWFSCVAKNSLSFLASLIRYFLFSHSKNSLMLYAKICKSTAQLTIFFKI